MRNEIAINHQMLRAAQNKAVIARFTGSPADKGSKHTADGNAEAQGNTRCKTDVLAEEPISYHLPVSRRADPVSG